MGGVKASRTASRNVPNMVSGDQTRNAPFARCSQHTNLIGRFMYKALVPIQVLALDLAGQMKQRRSRGYCLDEAPQALLAAVPVLETATPSPPRTRALASAILTAPPSDRAGINLILLRRAMASRIGML